jgi:hypothetical protein
MESWELIARASIRDLVARYNANGDSGRFAQLLELFAPDAEMDVGGRPHRGRPAIEAMFRSVAQRTGPDKSARFIRHFTAVHQIDVLGPGEARGRCYYFVLTDRGLDHWGRYVDEYRCLDGRWVFWRRKVTTDAALPGGWGRAAQQEEKPA